MELKKKLFETVYKMWEDVKMWEKFAEGGNESDKRIYDDALTEWSALRSFITDAGLEDEYRAYLVNQ